MGVMEVQGVKAAARHHTGFFNIQLDHTTKGKIGLLVGGEVVLTSAEAKHLTDCLYDMARKLENANA